MSTAQSVLSRFKEYSGHLVDLAEVALVHAAGNVIFKSGFNVTNLSDEDQAAIRSDKLAYETSIEQAEAARQRAESVRVENERQRVTEYSVIINNLGGIQSSEASRVKAEEAREIAEQARDDAEKARAAAAIQSAGA